MACLLWDRNAFEKKERKGGKRNEMKYMEESSCVSKYVIFIFNPRAFEALIYGRDERPCYAIYTIE